MSAVTNPAIDIARGKAALTYFHNQALKYPQNYRLQLSELIDTMSKKPVGSVAFLEGFGSACSYVDDKTVSDAMKWLADKGEGKLPARYQAFFDALSNRAANPPFLDMANEVLQGTARDLAYQAKEIGDGVLSSTKSLITFAPLIIGGAALLYVFVLAKGHSSAGL